MLRKTFGALAAVLVATLLAVTLFGSIASAQEDDHDQVTVPVDATGGVRLTEGLVVFGTDVVCPNVPVRKLDASQGAAFVESFLADSLFGTPKLEKPPTDLPVCDANITWIYDGPGKTVHKMKYATDGTKAWLLFVGTDVWFVGGPRVKDSIDGKLKPVNTYVVPPTTTPKPTPTKKAAAKADDDDTPWGLIVGAGAVVGALLIGASVWAKRRSSGDAGEPEAAHEATSDQDDSDESV